MQHLTQEPREQKQFEFKSFDDSPMNRTGKGQEETDYEPPIPYKTGWRQDEDDERENEEEKNDIWDNWHGDGELFD